MSSDDSEVAEYELDERPKLAQMWALTGVLDGGDDSHALVAVVVV
jgi:hypothetical protein